MNYQDPIRIEQLEIGLAALFLSNNKVFSQKHIQAKSALLSDTLVGLPTENIVAFFKYVRDNEETLPTDGRLLKILRARMDKFGPETVKKIEAAKVDDDGEFATDEWRKEFFANLPKFRGI